MGLRYGQAHNTSTFSRILDGRGMRITGGGNVMVKEADQAIYDGKRNRWIYYYMGADGAYAVMEGAPAGNKINFVQVYPNSGPTWL